MTAANQDATPPALDTREKALAAARAAQDKKGLALTIVDVTGRCSYTDTIVIASATNERQAKAIAENVAEVLRAEYRERPMHREYSGNWALIDYGDVMVHVFTEEARAYYDLDTLWGDAPRVAVPAPTHSVPAPPATPTALARRRR
jgi:ribosome-associated protein